MILFNCISFQIRTYLKGKNSLPEGANSFLYEQFLQYSSITVYSSVVWKITYHIKWPPLNVTIFITHARILRNGCYANWSWLYDIASCISCVLSGLWERRGFFNIIEKVQRTTACHWTCKRWRNTSSVAKKCLMSLSSHLLTPVVIGPPCFSFTRFNVVLCLLKKTSTWSLLSVRKQPGHHIAPNIVDTRPEELSPPPPKKKNKTIPRWNSLSPSREFRAFII